MKDDLEVRCDYYNLEKKKNWPKIIFDKDWLMGVWYCPRSFQKQTFYGQYPLTYLTRVRLLFGNLRPFVHLFAGIVKPEAGEITIDNDTNLSVDYHCEATSLPFNDNTVKVIVADPPYSPTDAEHYFCKKYPKMKDVFLECDRVLDYGGYLCFLHTHLLSIPLRTSLKLRGTIGILTGTNARFRLLSIYRKEHKAEEEK